MSTGFAARAGVVERAFDPEGADYDYEGAKAAGITPDETGHWASRDPKSGLILKGRGHETFEKTMKGEEEAGFQIVKKGERYYSFPKDQAAAAPAADDEEPLPELAGRRGTTRADFETVSSRIAQGESFDEAATGFRLFHPEVREKRMRERAASDTQTLGLFRASAAQQEATERVMADDNLRADYFNTLIRKAEEQFGVKLENPTRGGYGTEARKLYMEMSRQRRAAMLRGDKIEGDLPLVPELREQIFNRELNKAIESRPELGDLAAEVQIQMNPHLQRRAREQELELRQAEAGPIKSMAVGLGAGIWTTMRDPVEGPLNAVVTVATGGASPGVRMLSAIVGEGLTNVGITALTLPQIIERRNVSGIKAPGGGAEVAMELVTAFLIGGSIGGAVQGVREMFGTAVRSMALPANVQADIEASIAGIVRNVAGEGLPPDLHTVARSLSPVLDEGTQKELAAILRTLEIEQAAEAPPGVNPQTHDITLGAAVRHAEDPEATIAPAPLPRPADWAADDAEVRAAIPPNATLEQALAPLIADGRLAYLAATSRSLELEALGRIALMDERAAAFAVNGQVPVDQVARVSALVGAPEDQILVLQSLARDGVGTLEQVSERVAAELGATKIRDVVQTLLPTPERVTEIAPAEPSGGPPVAKTEAGTPGTPAAGEATPGASQAVPEASATAATEIPPPVKPIRSAADTPALKAEQPARSIDELYVVAPTHQNELGMVGAEIAAATGARFKNPGVKEKETTRQKMVRKDYRSTQELTDVVRAGFLVDVPNQGDAIVARLAAKYPILDEGWNFTAEGYFDRKVLVQFDDGTIGEIQIWEPNLFNAKTKQGGHDMYTESRALPLDNPRRISLDEQMRALYGGALAKATPEFQAMMDQGRMLSPGGVSTGSSIGTVTAGNRAANVSTVSQRPDSQTSTGSTALGSSPGLRMNAEASEPITAARPSQSTSFTETSVSNLDTVAASVETPEARQAVARVDAVNQLKEVPAYTPETAPPPSPGEMAGVFMFDPAKLKVDAQRFQFKEESDAEGVSTRLRGVTKWDPAKAGQLIVWEAKDGTLYVADGHQRTGLARRLQREGKVGDIEMTGALYRETDGYSPGDVKALAALVNISQGTGSALDIAHVLRKRPGALDESVPLTAGAARQGANLAKLEDEPFRMIVNKVIPEHYGAIVGELLPGDAARQADAIKQIASLEPRNVNEATYLVQRVRESEMQRAADASQMTFLDDTPGSTVGEEMRIFNKVKGELEKDKTLFKRVLANAGRIEETGSTIARPEAETMLTESALAAKLLESGFTSGPVREAIKEAATNVKAGNQTLAGATRDVLGVVRREAETNVPGGRGPGGGVQTPGSALTEPTAAGEQTLIPGVEPVTNQDRIAARAAEPMRGGAEPLPAGGLDDYDAINQTNLFDTGKPFETNDLAQAKPVAAPDGTVRLSTPEDVKAELERPAHLTDVVKSCKE
jgi:hypothetical protein